MAGASDAAFEKGRFLLEEMSAPTKLFVVKGGVGAGSNMKMVHQVLAAIHILAVSESFGLAARLGLDAKEFRETVVGGEAWSWMFENRSVRTLSEDYFPGASALTIVLKDAVSIPSKHDICSRSLQKDCTWGCIVADVWLTVCTIGHNNVHGTSPQLPTSTVLHHGASLLLGCR